MARVVFSREDLNLLYKNGYSKKDIESLRNEIEYVIFDYFFYMW